MATDRASDADDWISLSLAWTAGAIGAGIVIFLVLIAAIIVITCRHYKRSRR